jgi:hypothetical protein
MQLFINGIIHCSLINIVEEKKKTLSLPTLFLNHDIMMQAVCSAMSSHHVVPSSPEAQSNRAT